MLYWLIFLYFPAAMNPRIVEAFSLLSAKNLIPLNTLYVTYLYDTLAGLYLKISFDARLIIKSYLQIQKKMFQK